MNENRYRITKQWINKFQKAIDDLELINLLGSDALLNAEIASLISQLHDMQEELQAMENEDNG